MSKHARFIGWVITFINTIPIIDAMFYADNEGIKLNVGDGASETRHMDICCFRSQGYMNWERNESGHTISKSGIMFEMMEWISFSENFEYECLPQIDSERYTFDNDTNAVVWTPLYQMKHGLCDVSPQPYVITYSRFKYYCDFLSPFIYTPFSLLIPVPQYAKGGYISSVFRPFENSVWTTLLISIAVTIFLSLIHWIYGRSRATQNKQEDKVSLDLHWLFLFGLLVSKAGFRAPNSFKMRLAGGAWCIAALILTNYYSSILTSLITASSPVPIANSVEDVANNDNVELVIQKGFATALMIGDGKNSSSLLKKLDKKLQSSRDSLCPKEKDCFRQVVEKKTTTFLQDQPSLLALVSEDYRKTGRCNTAIAKEPYGMILLAWAIAKNHSQFENFQRGLLRIMEAGLVGHWKEIHLPTPIQCMVDPSSRQAKMADIRNPALVDLQGLVPSFLFLLFGFILALVALIAEWIRNLKLWKSIPFFRFPSQKIL